MWLQIILLERIGNQFVNFKMCLFGEKDGKFSITKVSHPSQMSTQIRRKLENKNNINKATKGFHGEVMKMKRRSSQAWWHMPVIPMFSRLG